ncbi:MAG: hypothetical protein PF488_01840 [Patescibacteria group bacterium]|jgi:hypothetical protein|nr:hypothetical protein [Patescibacteria group bacterium]
MKRDLIHLGISLLVVLLVFVSISALGTLMDVAFTEEDIFPAFAIFIASTAALYFTVKSKAFKSLNARIKGC